MHTWTLDKPDNLVDWWEESAAKFADRKLFGTKNKAGSYEWVTYKEINERIRNLRAGLAQLEVGKMMLSVSFPITVWNGLSALLPPGEDRPVLFPCMKRNWFRYGNTS